MSMIRIPRWFQTNVRYPETKSYYTHKRTSKSSPDASKTPIYDVTSGMFDYVWSRLKNLVGASGVSHSEARSWHRRVYGGQVDITTLLPGDLGAAAGYEVFRLFRTYNSIYAQPLMGDRERQEEALAGLAIAEATKLWSYCQRPSDKYGRRESCEVAAATAERLFRRARRAARDGDDYDYSNDGNYIDDDDSDSDGYNSRRRRRGSHSDGRRRRASVNYGMYAQPGVGAGALAIPGAVTPTAGGYVPTYGNVGVQYAQASPGMQTMPLGGVGYGGAQVAGGYGVQQVPMPVSPYQQAAYLPQVGVPGAGYAAGAGGLLGVPGAGGVRQRSNSFTGYPASPGYY